MADNHRQEDIFELTEDMASAPPKPQRDIEKATSTAASEQPKVGAFSSIPPQPVSPFQTLVDPNAPEPEEEPPPSFTPRPRDSKPSFVPKPIPAPVKMAPIQNVTGKTTSIIPPGFEHVAGLQGSSYPPPTSSISSSDPPKSKPTGMSSKPAPSISEDTPPRSLLPAEEAAAPISSIPPPPEEMAAPMSSPPPPPEEVAAPMRSSPPPPPKSDVIAASSPPPPPAEVGGPISSPPPPPPPKSDIAAVSSPPPPLKSDVTAASSPPPPPSRITKSEEETGEMPARGVASDSSSTDDIVDISEEIDIIGTNEPEQDTAVNADVPAKESTATGTADESSEIAPESDKPHEKDALPPKEEELSLYEKPESIDDTESDHDVERTPGEPPPPPIDRAETANLSGPESVAESQMKEIISDETEEDEKEVEEEAEELDLSEAEEMTRTGPPAPPIGGGFAAEGRKPKSRRRHKPSKEWWAKIFNDDYVSTIPKATVRGDQRKVNFIEKSLGVSKHALVLDLACGNGRHSVGMAKRGYRLVGIDLSLPMLAQAAELAQDENQNINFIHGDMRDLSFDKTFDAIFCMGTSFGYFSDEVNLKVLQGVFRALKPGGTFLIEVANRDHVITQTPDLNWFEGNGSICMEESYFDFKTSRLHVTRQLIMDGGRQVQNNISIRLYTLHELEQFITRTGFTVGMVSGHTATPGAFFGPDSVRIFITAQRPL
jgi:SAM-dependent methyltransferase